MASESTNNIDQKMIGSAMDLLTSWIAMQRTPTMSQMELVKNSLLHLKGRLFATEVYLKECNEESKRWQTQAWKNQDFINIAKHDLKELQQELAKAHHSKHIVRQQCIKNYDAKEAATTEIGRITQAWEMEREEWQAEKKRLTQALVDQINESDRYRAKLNMHEYDTEDLEEQDDQLAQPQQENGGNTEVDTYDLPSELENDQSEKEIENQRIELE